MGIFSSKTFDPVTEIPDLKGKVFLITGGNRGIGFRTIQELARHGAKVYMGARNESAATGAIAQLEAEGLGPGHGSVVWLKLDLSSPKSSKEAAEEFMRREKRLDVLINNAALMVGRGHHKNIDAEVSISESMSTNHLGHFIFTNTLLPLLEQTASLPGTDVRIITVSSMAFKQASSVDWTDLSTWRSKPGFQGMFSSMNAYSQTKLANVLFARELQERLDAKGSSILSIAVHPGPVDTTGAALFLGSAPLADYWLKPLMGLFQLTEPQGAYTSLYAGTSPTVRRDAEKWKGAYAVPYGVIEEHKAKGTLSLKNQKDLWATTEDIARKNLK